MRRRLLAPLAVGGAIVASVPAFAVSDGGYDYSKQGCTSNAENSDTPNRTEPHCYSITVVVSDATHRYVTVGIPQTADGQTANAVELCLDFTGSPQCARVDKNGYTPWTGASTGAPNPQSAELHAYFGMDDNIDSGEHDSSEYVDNGPSDGGSIRGDVTPLSAVQWLQNVQAHGASFFLTHPLPVGDGGVGFCADGICISAQTERRVAYRGSSKSAPARDVANYSGHQWDPESCSGPTDEKGPNQCGKHNLKWWDQQNGTTYVQPGIQIYEDPDPQGSPEFVPYPLPALYVGTCGLIAGGGPAPAPASPFTNDAHQLVVSTGC